MLLEPIKICYEGEKCPERYKNLISGVSCEKCEVNKCLQCSIDKSECEVCEKRFYVSGDKKSCLPCITDCN